MPEDLTPDEHRALAVLMSEGDVLEEIEATIRSTAQRFLEVGATDLNAFATRLAGQVVYAQATGNAEIIASAARQARLLAELQRVRANDAAWDTFYSVVEDATRVAVRVATNLLLKGATIVAP